MPTPLVAPPPLLCPPHPASPQGSSPPMGTCVYHGAYLPFMVLVMSPALPGRQDHLCLPDGPPQHVLGTLPAPRGMHLSPPCCSPSSSHLPQSLRPHQPAAHPSTRPWAHVLFTAFGCEPTRTVVMSPVWPTAQPGVLTYWAGREKVPG